MPWIRLLAVSAALLIADSICAAEDDDAMRELVERQAEQNSRLIQAAFEPRLQREGGLLLGFMQLVYEPGLSFTHSSYDSIVVDGFTVYPVLVVGDIVAEKVRRDIITNSHAFRLGIGAGLQLDLNIPYTQEDQEAFRDDGFYQTRRAGGIGDISLGLSRQLTRSGDFWPDSIVALNWKSTTGEDPYETSEEGEIATGNGFDSYALSWTAMSNADPLVLYGGISTTYSQEDKKPIGEVQPGQSWGLNLGLALALNFDNSLSFNFQFQNTQRTKIDRQRINGSDSTTANFSIGLSSAITSSVAVDVDIGLGLTADSPDFQLTLSLPISFVF